MKLLQEGAARLAYGLVLWLLAPAYVVRLWCRGGAEPLYRHAIGERFGLYRDVPSAGWVWVHAVSLGETRAAAALVAALRMRIPGMRLLLSHGTATGREAGIALLQDGDRQVWLPFDAGSVVRRFLAHFRPCIGVLMETEVWPHLIGAAVATGVPMVLANARLSARSERRGAQLASLLRPAIDGLARVLAQSEADAARLRRAGARDVEVCGNLKFDASIDAGRLAQGRAWRAALDRPVVLAAVTREGEEAALFAAWTAGARPRPLLLVVPRHPQRFDEVAAAAQAAELALVRRSDWPTGGPDGEASAADVWLGDSMGEMALYYGIADLALLGGSFAPFGGQNLIEAAACGCPVVMGPHTFNFAEAAALALAAGAARRVADIDAAVTTALGLVGTDEAERMRRSALGFAASHRGAAARMADRIVALLGARRAAVDTAAVRPAARSA